MAVGSTIPNIDPIVGVTELTVDARVLCRSLVRLVIRKGSEVSLHEQFVRHRARPSLVPPQHQWGGRGGAG